MVELLADIRSVFDARAIDRIFSADLCDALHEMEDRPWNEWRGPQDNRLPHPLSPNDLSDLLCPFGIKSQSIWPRPRPADAKSKRGYYRHQFETAWASYVDLQEPDEEDAAPTNSPQLRLV